jgi:hypothetical protein
LITHLNNRLGLISVYLTINRPKYVKPKILTRQEIVNL